MFKLISVQNKPCQAFYIGSVEDVINGKIENKLRSKRFNASDFLYGFELASPDDIYSMGEAVIVNDYCFATSTNKNSSSYLKTISGHQFVSSGQFLLRKETAPNSLVEGTFSSPLSYNDFLNQLYQKTKHTYALAAFIHFKTLALSIIQSSPIDGKNIFENMDIYYPVEKQILEDQYVFVLSVFSDMTQNKNSGIQKVLYHNPCESLRDIQNHSHGLILREPILEHEKITPDLVNQVIHIHPDSSMIDSIQGQVFLIGTFKPWC